MTVDKAKVHTSVAFSTQTSKQLLLNYLISQLRKCFQTALREQHAGLFAKCVLQTSGSIVSISTENNL